MKVPQTRPQETTVIHWEFMRGRERVTCQIDRSQTIDGEPQFAVALVPSWYRQLDSREPFQAMAAALCHHAVLAARLRANGWRLVAYTR